MKNGNIFIITAPSGAGKSSLIKSLIEIDNSIYLSVSYTTRKPRSNEKDGVDYHFIDIDEFKRMCDEKQFIEFAKVHDNFYGTSKLSINDMIEKGKDILVEIDWQGAEQIRLHYPDSTSIFILPPSLEEMERRLINRAEDSKDTINKRMTAASKELQYAKKCDFIVINNNFKKALDDLLTIINSFKLKFKVQAIKNIELFAKLGVTTD